MNVDYTKLVHFRNHTHSILQLGPGVNVLLGKNAQGKTNVLEAISYLCLTKSFYGASDATLVQLGQKGFELEGTLLTDTGTRHSVNLTYEVESAGKSLVINSVKIDRLARIVGMFPVVILAPENGAITLGGPSDRRRFIDILLSQVSRSYFEHLLEYRQILRQRNRILAEAKQHRSIRDDVLDPWNQSLAHYGARIMHTRMRFVEEFANYVLRSHADLVDAHEEPQVRYVTELEEASASGVDEIAQSILTQLRLRQQDECRRGTSLVGPHRDELAFSLNGIELQKYASQGQHKTFLVALKMAEFFYIKDKKDETPLFLLDDVMSELDGDRSRRLLGHIANQGQAIITTTEESPFDDIIQWGQENRKFYVQQGTCKASTFGIAQEAALGTP